MTPDMPTPRGFTYEPMLDGRRLARQARIVYAYIADGHWRTLYQIAGNTGFPEASISARLRDFRRIEGHTVERRRVPDHPGLWQYRLQTPCFQMTIQL